MNPTTLADLLDLLAEFGDAPAIQIAGDKDAAWSFRRLREEARSLALAIDGEELDRNTPIAILGENSPEWIATFLGITRSGRIAMPLNAIGSDDELRSAFDDSGCRHAFVSAAFAERIAALELDPEPSLLRLGADDADGLKTIEGVDGELPALETDDVACLLYTSGTTGEPKGVPLTHGNLASNIRSMIEAEMAGPQDRICLPLPLHHAYPLTVGALSPLACGTLIVMPKRMSGRAIKSALTDEACTILLGVPRLYEALLEALYAQFATQPQPISTIIENIHGIASGDNPILSPMAQELMMPVRNAFGPSLRIAACGGAKLDVASERALRGLGFEVLTGYGLTETSPIATFNPPGQSRIGTAGCAVKDVEIRITKDEDDDQQGVIEIRGPNVFRGYWGRERRDDDGLSDDGWYTTGDLGFVDEEGYLHLTGRQKELLVLAGGKNIIPDTIEQKFVGLDAVRELAAIERDGKLELIIVPETGNDDEQAIKDSIRNAAQDEPSYARPSAVHIVNKGLPRTLIGKLKRHELNDLLEGGGDKKSTSEKALSSEDQALLHTPPAGSIFEWLEERYADHDVSLDANPQLDLGFDSFEWMNVALVLEDRFDVQLNEDELAEVETIRDLLERSVDAQGRSTSDSGSQDIDESWLEPRSGSARATAAVLRDSNRFFMRRFFNLEIEGKDHIPENSPFIVTANHQSHLDSFAIAAALSNEILERTFWAGATKVYFNGPLIRRFSRIANLLPIENDFGSFSALDYGRRVLERGDILVWYPEGHRTRDGELLDFRPGVGVLMAELGVPALPMIIEGTGEAMPPGSKLPRFRNLALRIGAPLPAEELLGRPVGDNHQDEAREIVDALRSRIKAMLEERSV